MTGNLGTRESFVRCRTLAVIRIYREFERFILNCIVASINNDTRHLSSKKGVDFPRHLSDEICEYIVIGDGYFDFKGRSGLIKELKRYLPTDHFVVEEFSSRHLSETIDCLAALRNHAAHNSQKSKSAALNATGRTRLGSAGSHLKANRGAALRQMINELRSLAERIEARAPY